MAALLNEVIILELSRIYTKVWNSIPLLLVLMRLWLITAFQPRLFPYLEFSPYRLFPKSRLSRLGILEVGIAWE